MWSKLVRVAVDRLLPQADVREIALHVEHCA